MPGTYHLGLVALSIVLAVLASAVALGLTERMTVAEGWGRRVWGAAGALALGVGIWSMHFVGMLALQLPIPVTYDAVHMTLSALLAVGASFVALSVVSRPRPGRGALVGGALGMGGAIAGMHYLGMASMRLPATMYHDQMLVLASLAVAAGAAGAAFSFAYRLRERGVWGRWARLVAALLMGGAIAGMHYTAMAAASFTPHAPAVRVMSGAVVATTGLAGLVFVATAIVLALAVLGIAADRWLRQRLEAATVQARLYAEAEAAREALARHLAESQRLAGDLEAANLRLAAEAASAERARRQAEESERRFRQMADAAPVLIWISDERGGCEWVNVPWTTFTGRSLEAERAGGWLEAVHPEDRSAARLCVPALREGAGEANVVEFRLRQHDGQYRWMLGHSVPRRGEHGQFLGCIASVVDISERQAALEAEQGARAAAERANRAKSDFLAAMSHELRTPLNAILGYAELLHDGVAGTVSDEQRGQLERIQRSGRHLIGLVDEVLSLTSMEPIAGGTADEEVVVAALLDEAVESVGDGIFARGLELRVEHPEAGLRLRTDRALLRRVLVNLLANAGKFTERGRITLSARCDGTGILLSVCDTGIGIAERDLAQIWEPFWQVDQGHTRRAGGAGVGLAVVQRTLDLLEGRVTVTSAPGKGSCFEVRLPLVRQGRAEPAGARELVAVG